MSPTFHITNKSVAYDGMMLIETRNGLDKVQREWKSECDPPASWYSTFSSMLYTVESHWTRKRRYIFVLTPVPGRLTYTFDTIDRFVETVRVNTLRVLEGQISVDLPVYRIRRGPPCIHILYRLPPEWD